MNSFSKDAQVQVARWSQSGVEVPVLSDRLCFWVRSMEEV